MTTKVLLHRDADDASQDVECDFDYSLLKLLPFQKHTGASIHSCNDVHSLTLL